MLEQVETHFKNRLNSLSKDLFLEHGWQLPDGYKENGWKNPLNFTLAEWQQATPLHPRAVAEPQHRASFCHPTVAPVDHARETSALPAPIEQRAFQPSGHLTNRAPIGCRQRIGAEPDQRAIAPP